MAGVLKVAGLSAKAGTRVAGTVGLKIAGQALDLPLFLVNGAGQGPSLTVMAGVHGCEYASIEAVLQLGRSLDPDQVRGTVILAPVVNVPAFRARSIYVSPADGKNLNRCFPGSPDGTYTDQLAHWLFQNIMKVPEYLIDLHGGDLIEALIPFSIFHRSGTQALDARSLELAKVFGIDLAVRTEIAGSSHGSAMAAGVVGMAAEAGGQGLWPPDQVALLRHGVERVMKHLGMLPGPEPEPRPVQVLDRFEWLRSRHDGYYYPRVAVGDVVADGQDLGAVTDFRGEVLQPLAAPCDGRVLFLVSNLAINKGDPLLAVGV